MRRDPAQQPNRQTEKRATAVSCVDDHKHTLSRPTLSLCCWASVKTQHTAVRQHHVLYVSSCCQAAAWTTKSWNCAAFTFRRCGLKRLEIFRRCVHKKKKKMEDGTTELTSNKPTLIESCNYFIHLRTFRNKGGGYCQTKSCSFFILSSENSILISSRKTQLTAPYKGPVGPTVILKNVSNF